MPTKDMILYTVVMFIAVFFCFIVTSLYKYQSALAACVVGGSCVLLVLITWLLSRGSKTGEVKRKTENGKIKNN